MARLLAALIIITINNNIVKPYSRVKAMYCPRVAAVSCTQKPCYLGLWPLTYDPVMLGLGLDLDTVGLVNITAMTSIFNMLLEVARYMFVLNFIKLSAAVYELPCAQSKNSHENNNVRRYRGQ